jgi:hypothetical protein
MYGDFAINRGQGAWQVSRRRLGRPPCSAERLAGGGIRVLARVCAERTLTPNPSPCAQGEGLSAPHVRATIGVAAPDVSHRIARRLPSPCAQGEGLGVRVLSGKLDVFPHTFPAAHRERGVMG